ncbi:MFS transporter [Nocardia xishanensis]
MTSELTSAGRTVVLYRQIAAASVGNAAEWFDWYIYSMLAVYFAKQFFPSSTGNSLVPLLGTMAIFAVGFFARPLGGLIIGGLADRYGRKATLSATVVGMGAGSLLIGLAPTYEQVGILAPLLLLVARLIQGFSAGGEYAASSAFLVESAPPQRRGFFASFFQISATSANLVAIGLSALLTNVLDKAEMSTWGWRIPFLLGAVGAAVGLWIRTHAEETLQIEPDSETAPGGRRNIFAFLREYPRESLLVFGITAAPALAFYVWTSYLPTYASITVGFDPKQGLLTGAIALTWFLILQPVFGILSDRIGRKPMLLTFGVAFTVGAVPLLHTLGNSWTSVLTVQLVGLTFLAFWSSISNAVAAELFPARLRSAGIGFPYALAVAVFGGTGPYVATWLVDLGHANAFAWYIAAVALLSSLVYLALPETAREPLR